MKLLKKILKWFAIIFIVLPISLGIIISLLSDQETAPENQLVQKESSLTKSSKPSYQIEPKFIRNYEFLNILGGEEEAPGVEFFNYHSQDPEFTGFYVLYLDGSIGEYYNIDSIGMRNVTVPKEHLNDIINTLIAVQDNFIAIKAKDFSSIAGECIKENQHIYDSNIEYSVCAYENNKKSYSASFQYGNSLTGMANFSFTSSKLDSLNEMITILTAESQPTKEHKKLLIDYYNKINSVSIL
ncbi:hypothetical protein AB733_24405 [Photobacterium swingsii]|uniref:hypothetical protein n=1 Tax=Photobacterium swingsii TaxID=680026 RepID=UPI000662A692|nr:hypothetical protein [Photobacterium swingsii]KMV28324.1 hypothetical protein AB733_24405 [Photobacterium swingsii]